MTNHKDDENTIDYKELCHYFYNKWDVACVDASRAKDEIEQLKQKVREYEKIIEKYRKFYTVCLLSASDDGHSGNTFWH